MRAHIQKRVDTRTSKSDAGQMRYDFVVTVKILKVQRQRGHAARQLTSTASTMIEKPRKQLEL